MIFIALLPLLVLSFLFGIFSIRQVTETQRTSFQIVDYLFLAAGFACFIFATSGMGKCSCPRAFPDKYSVRYNILPAQPEIREPAH